MIDIKDLCKVYLVGDERVRALDHATLHIYPQEFVSIIGPSGSGKSTLMNIIGCLDIADAGSYCLDGLPIEAYSENELAKIRNQKIGFVFQSFNLIPKLTAEENVELPLIYQRVKRSEREKRVREALEMVGLTKRAKHLPTELSGGQQQRVAIARALAKMPRVLLLDEPLSNLDARLRLQTREEIRRIQKETGITTVFVTHDQEEAMSISDMIVVMKLGVVQQIGQPQDVYDDPTNLFVAKFLGTPPINVLEGKVCDGKVIIGEDVVLEITGVEDQDVFIGIRPEGFELDENGTLRCRLENVEVMGRDVSIVSTHPASVNAQIRSIINADNKVDVTKREVTYRVKPHKFFLFNKETEERIRYEVK
jgi:multiple sugar transport system ATP-binding protein